MSWNKVKLGELLDSFSVRAKDIGGSGNLSFLGVSNEDGITKSKYAAEDKAEEYKIIEKGCFAYNPYRINVGSIAYLNEDTKGLISPAYVVFKTKTNSIKDELLLKFLKSGEGLRQIKQNARGTVRQALRFEDLCKIEISIPDYPEQEKIFQKLNETEQEANALTSELTRQLDFVKQLRQSFLREAMQGKLVPQDPKDEPASELLQKIKTALRQAQDDKKGKKQKEEHPPVKDNEIPFVIPENWVWCRLGEIAISVSTGPFGTMLHKSDYVANGIPLVNPMNIVDGKIVPSDKMSINEETRALLKGYVLKKGDIVIGRRGDMGRCAVVTEKENGWLCGTGSFFVKLYDCVDRDFFVKVLSSEYSKKSLLGSSVGATMNNLNHRILNNLLIPLPPLAEQHRILTKLEQLMQLCDDLEQSIRQSKEQTNMLLQAALREALQPARLYLTPEEIGVVEGKNERTLKQTDKIKMQVFGGRA